MLRRTGSVVVALVTAAGMGLAGAQAGASEATADRCGIRWGSGPVSATAPAAGHLVDIRSGRKDCYDRLVFDISGASPSGFSVSYVDEVTQDGSGDPVPLRGGARLQITVHNPAHDESYRPTYEYDDRAELVGVRGYRTFRQVAWAGSFEGTTTVGLGVRARLPIRAFTYGNRVVVDVAHRW